MLDEQNHVYNVGELNGAASDLLEEAFNSVQVTGELHEIRRPASGHWYFTLKDEQHELRCVMFRGDNQQVAKVPVQGDQILLRGRLTIYRQRGQYQLVVRQLEAAGEGVLLKRFEELRRRLTAEGLFDPERKKPLPPCPRHLALVTSATGAAGRDVLAVAFRRAPLLSITLVPAQVQGDRAAPSICRALDLCESFSETAGSRGLRPVDAVLICRGGGSLEDLWAFNEEAVVRRVAGMKIPSVSGVGHETDITLTDFAADLRAPTPSAGAEILTEAQSLWPAAVADQALQLDRNVRRTLKTAADSLAILQDRLTSPTRQLQQRQQRLDEMEERLQLSARRSMADQQRKFADLNRRLSDHLRAGTALRGPGRRINALQASLRALSPLAVLERGYAILTDEAGRACTDAASVNPDDRLNARLARGNLKVRVESVSEHQ